MITRLTIVCCCLLDVPAYGWQAQAHGVKRLYIEAFTTKTDAEKLREDLAAELRRLKSIALVSDESSADIVLGGGGEIWIKGYRSLNPRSGRLPSDGTPVYAGYLEVELKSKNSVTLWSDLVTPGAESADVSKDLAKRITKHLAEALEKSDPPPPAAATPQTSAMLNGAGATFPYPVYLKWFTNYGTANPGVKIAYDAIGSEAGIRKVLAGSADFAASDSPEGVHEIAPGDENKYLFFPSVIGAVVPIVNLPGIPDTIALTPEALAGIYLGKIKKWNDPILKQANRGVRLPDLDIVVVHRSDGSGTSYAWTDYLSQTSPEWKAEVGSGLAPKWPTGRGAAGNEGVAAMVKELGGSIGYVEFIYALQHHIGYGKVRNQNGEFVDASLESIAAAVSHSMEIRDDLKTSIVDAPGEGSYPIASFTWLVIPAHVADAAKRSAISAFLRWMLGPGQRQAAALGYLALPSYVVAKEEDAIGKIH